MVKENSKKRANPSDKKRQNNDGKPWGNSLILLINIKCVNKMTIGVNSLTKLEHPGPLISERGREVADIIKNKKTHVLYGTRLALYIDNTLK